MRKEAVFTSIEAALKYAGDTGCRVSVDVKQAAEQLTGGLGPLSTPEVWAIKQMRKRAQYLEAVGRGDYQGRRERTGPSIKIV